jgi:hypothetical protein
MALYFLIKGARVLTTLKVSSLYARLELTNSQVPVPAAFPSFPAMRSR